MTFNLFPAICEALKNLLVPDHSTEFKWFSVWIKQNCCYLMSGRKQLTKNNASISSQLIEIPSLVPVNSSNNSYFSTELLFYHVIESSSHDFAPVAEVSVRSSPWDRRGHQSLVLAE